LLKLYILESPKFVWGVGTLPSLKKKNDNYKKSHEVLKMAGMDESIAYVESVVMIGAAAIIIKMVMSFRNRNASQ
jgi:hypothetical protein